MFILIKNYAYHVNVKQMQYVLEYESGQLEIIRLHHR